MDWKTAVDSIELRQVSNVLGRNADCQCPVDFSTMKWQQPSDAFQQSAFA
jgi:hypothetical protein